MKHFKLLFIIIFISLLACAQKNKSTVEAEVPTHINYTTEIVVPELDIPWGFVFLPDGGLLITEKKGELIYSKDGIKNEKMIKDDDIMKDDDDLVQFN